MSNEHDVPERFVWKGISFFHDSSVLKIGTDALLLASWIPKIINSPGNVLDIGTGSGIIAILLAKAYPDSLVTGIDPEDNAVHLAQINTDTTGYNRQVRIIQSGVKEFAVSSTLKFDLIVSNPPFYVNHIIPVSGALKSAKHAVDTPAEWLKYISHLLSDKGQVSVILPSTICFEWTREANANQLYVHEQMDVYSNSYDDTPKRSMLCFSRYLIQPKYSTIRMYEADKTYTPEYHEWLGI